jgi:hypothetical protein
MEGDLMNTVIPNLPDPTSNLSTIPLNLFQTWHTEVLPPKMFECVTSLKDANPEFKHFFFNDAMCREFIQQHFDPHVLHAYDMLRPGAYKADLWRYCVLYAMGGIYVDIKYRCIPPFKLLELTTQEHYVRDRDYGDNPGVYQAILVCYPKNPILKQCITKIVEYVNTMEYGANVLFIGPLLVSKYFNRSEMLTWPLTYTGLQVVRNQPLMEIYPEYFEERKQTSISPYYMDLWCNRNIYAWKSLPFRKQTLMTRTISDQRILFLTSPKWIDQGTTRVLFNQWSSYVSHEDGTFTGLPESRLSRIETKTDTFTGFERLFDLTLTHFTAYAQDGIQYVYESQSVYGGADSADLCKTPIPTPLTMKKMSPLSHKNVAYFVYEWYPLVLLDTTFKVSEIHYHTHAFLKGCTSSVPCIQIGDVYWTIVTKCVQYELKGIPYKKYAHLFVVLNMNLSVVKYSEFFILHDSHVSIVSDAHFQENTFTLGYTISNGICIVAEFSMEDVSRLHWNYVIA